MKKIISLFLLLFVCGLLKAQYVISINNKKRLTIKESENNAALILKLTPPYPAKAMLSIKEIKQNKGWLRSYDITDNKDNVITSLENTYSTDTKQTLIQQLIKKLEPGEKYSIYTWAKPSDPKLAASVRIRRIFLCALVIE